MSLATLKKKTKAVFNNPHIGDKYGKYSNMSAVRMSGYNSANGNVAAGFSLNGTHRSQGYIGQSMQQRHFASTPMRGNVARGHGGCCGQYPTNNGHIIQSGVVSQNNPNVVKGSVLNTQGHYHTHYKWIWRPQPYTSVKPNSYNHLGTQDMRTQHLAKCAVKASAASDAAKGQIRSVSQGCCKNASHTTLMGEVVDIKPVKNITKPESFTGAHSSGYHIAYLSNGCANNDVFVNKNPTNNTPFGCSNPRV